MLPKTSAYVKCYDGQPMQMYFLTEDNTMWYKVSIDMKKGFDSEPVYKKEFLKTKVTSHGNEVKDFCDKENPK